MSIATTINNANIKITTRNSTIGKVFEVHAAHVKAAQPKQKHEPKTVNRGFASKDKTLLAGALVKQCFSMNGIDTEKVSVTVTYEGNTDNTVRYLKVTYDNVTFDVTTPNAAFGAFDTYIRLKDKAERDAKNAREKLARQNNQARKALETLLKAGLLSVEEYRAKCAALNA